MDKNRIEEIASSLYAAEKNLTTLPPLSDTEQGASIDDAYAIQLSVVNKKLADGEVISGKKIGLTSKAMQEMAGVDEPDYGHIFASLEFANGSVPTDILIQPKAEAEIAFILKEDVKGPNATAADVLAATEYVAAAFEIVDSRIADWKIKLFDTVADNASFGCYVLGEKRVAPADVDLIAEEMVLFKNGEEVAKGVGAAALGDPAYCVAWLANKLHKYGVTLGKGEVILSGALTGAAAAEKGDVFRAEFGALGSVEARFE